MDTQVTLPTTRPAQRPEVKKPHPWNVVLLDDQDRGLSLILLLLILRTVVYFNPLRFFLPLGALFFAGGLAKFGYDVTKWNLSESAVMGLLTGVMIWCVGLLADQNSRLALRGK